MFQLYITYEPMDLFKDISFQTSKLITKKYSTSFSIAVSFLPYQMRQAIYSLYGFVRLADEIVDTFHEVDQRQILDNFERDYREALNYGISMNPVLHAFALTVKKYQLPEHLVDSFLKSMKADLSKQVYSTTAELNEYIYGSADVVGLMCLMIFVNGDQKQFDLLQTPAMKLGSAFQKVNFLRDLKADYEQLDRQYFPQFDIRSFNDEMKSKLVENIESDFLEAKKGIKLLPGKSKLAVYIAYVYYRRLLADIRRTPASQIMSSRISVPNSTKFLLLGRAYVAYKFNIV